MVRWIPEADDDAPRVLPAADALKSAKADAVFKSQRWVLGDVQKLFSHLSEKHRIVVAYGTGYYGKEREHLPLVWKPIDAGAPVPPVRAIGRPGGQASCPAIRFVSPDSAEWIAFAEFIRAEDSD